VVHTDGPKHVRVVWPAHLWMCLMFVVLLRFAVWV
jgi:hypothetical protein